MRLRRTAAAAEAEGAETLLLLKTTVGSLSTQVSGFPDLATWMKSLTGHPARAWAHRVTPGSGEPGPFCRRALRPAAAYPPRLPQDEQPHPPPPGADRGCRGHPGSGADAEPSGLGPGRLRAALRGGAKNDNDDKKRPKVSGFAPKPRDLGVKPGSAAPPNLGPRRNQNRPKTQTLA